MRDLNCKKSYTSPELDIRWFESEDVIALSDAEVVTPPGDSWADDNEW